MIILDTMESLRPHLKKRLLGVGILLFFLLLESTMLVRIRVFNIHPDIILIAVIITALDSPLSWTLFFGWLAGMLSDIIGVPSYGINTLLFTLWGFLTYELSKKLIIDSQWRLLALVALTVLLHNIAAAIFFALSGSPFPLGIFLLSSFIGSLYSAAVSPLILKLFKYINQ